MTLLLDIMAPQILILGIKRKKYSLNEMFRPLISGIVCLCRSNMTGDVIKVKTMIFTKCQFML